MSAGPRYTATTRVLAIDPAAPDPTTIAQAAAIIRAGGLVAFPTETVYGLGADALAPEAAARIFSAKLRPTADPLIVHLASADALDTVAADVPEVAARLAAAFWPGPLTLILRKQPIVPDGVTAGTPTVAVRVPGGRVARALITAAGTPIAAPSANLFTRPSATHAAHVLDDLGGHVDLVLDGGPAPIGVESTIVDCTGDPVVVRPGGIALETLRAVVPGLSLRVRAAGAGEAGLTAPGQMLKHYAPRAPMTVLTGDAGRVQAAMLAHAERAVREGRVIGVLTTREAAAVFTAAGALAIGLGDAGDDAAMARALFNAIRALDAAGVSHIFAHDIGRDGMGAAVWDRLVRAASGHVETV
jgi:L-threonylcarbamoyladenylate synthase